MATLKPCDESVEQMARALMKEFESHVALLAVKPEIDFLFAYAELDDGGFPKGPALKLHGVACHGIARIIGYKQRVKGMGDAEISLDGDWWREASDAQRRALLDHELQHLTPKLKQGMPARDSLGRPLLKMRQHDVEVGWFAVIAERHGPASGERKQAQNIMDAYGQYFWPGFNPVVAAPLAHASTLRRAATEDGRRGGN